MNTAGMPCNPDGPIHALSIDLVAPSYATVYDIRSPCSRTNVSTLARVSSSNDSAYPGPTLRNSRTLTPRIVTPRSLYRACNSFKCGIAWMHGPHHVAQNSTTYTLPFS